MTSFFHQCVETANSRHASSNRSVKVMRSTEHSGTVVHTSLTTSHTILLVTGFMDGLLRCFEAKPVFCSITKHLHLIQCTGNLDCVHVFCPSAPSRLNPTWNRRMTYENAAWVPGLQTQLLFPSSPPDVRPAPGEPGKNLRVRRAQDTKMRITLLVTWGQKAPWKTLLTWTTAE